jgi:hypothetical protein
MKNNFKTGVLLSICSFVLFTACEKEDDARISSNTALITAAPWKLVSEAVSPGVDTDADGNLEYELIGTYGCSEDNSENFNPDLTILTDQGAVKCDPSTPQTSSTGNWAFINNETQLSRTYFNYPDSSTFNVISISNTEMILQIEEIRQNVTHTYTLKYIH